MAKRIEISRDLLKALNYSSTDEAALDMLFLSTRSRCSEFRQEVERFEGKYLMDFEAFRAKVEAKENQEDFAQEEDLMAWQFAKEAAAYWEKKVQELERAARPGETVR